MKNALTRYWLYEFLSVPPLHRRYLRGVYRSTMVEAQASGWPRSTLVEPKFLLCGVGTAHTAVEFVLHARAHFQNAQITLLDIRKHVLDKAIRDLRKSGLTHMSGIKVMAKNAVKSELDSLSYDWIETDHFFQFFNSEDMRGLILEWHRLLKPSGIVTTRFYPSHLATFTGAAFLRLYHRYCASILTAPCHLHSTHSIRCAIEEAGFTPRFTPTSGFAVSMVATKASHCGDGGRVQKSTN
jgi:ubiquinone/menaquinone biosynthesis C-methylase UbiE